MLVRRLSGESSMSMAARKDTKPPTVNWLLRVAINRITASEIPASSCTVDTPMAEAITCFIFNKRA